MVESRRMGSILFPERGHYGGHDILHSNSQQARRDYRSAHGTRRTGAGDDCGRRGGGLVAATAPALGMRPASSATGWRGPSRGGPWAARAFNWGNLDHTL